MMLAILVAVVSFILDGSLSLGLRGLIPASFIFAAGMQLRRQSDASATVMPYQKLLLGAGLILSLALIGIAVFILSRGG